MATIIKLTLGDELTEKVKREAEKKYLPVAAVVRMAVAEYLTRHSGRKPKGKG